MVGVFNREMRMPCDVISGGSNQIKSNLLMQEGQLATDNANIKTV